MTPEEIHLVRSSWEKIQPISAQAAELFYGRLFTIAPDLQRLFKGDMRQQGQRLMTMIDTAVKELERWDQLSPAVQALGKRHAGYGVKDADYDTVADALLWTLQTGLGTDFTDEVRLAWINTYTALADTMKAAAAEEAAA